jgi:hypothetical protein
MDVIHGMSYSTWMSTAPIALIPAVPSTWEWSFRKTLALNKPVSARRALDGVLSPEEASTFVAALQHALNACDQSALHSSFFFVAAKGTKAIHRLGPLRPLAGPLAELSEVTAVETEASVRSILEE